MRDTLTIDRISPDHILGTAEALLAGVGHTTAPHLMVLVDHALLPDRDLFRRWPGRLPTVFNLTGHLSSDTSIAPLLLALPASLQEHPAAVAYLLRRCNGQPMFSLLAGKIPPDLVAEHLTTLTSVLLPPDATPYLLRFADTRIVPALDRHLDDRQRDQLFGPFTHWAYLGRDATPAFIRGGGRDGGQGGLPAEGPIELTQAQCDALLRTCQADNFIPILRENAQHFADAPPSVQYRLTCEWIERATQAAGGSIDSGACLSYCLSCLEHRQPAPTTAHL